MKSVTILQFTDPICVWCWGNDPVMRAIEYLYGEKVKIEYVMGGLVEDITTLFDLRGEKSDIIRQANEIILHNWQNAAEKHGMPVVNPFAPFFTERYTSSFPQNIAYEVAKRLNPRRAPHFLRLMREATFVLGKRTSQIDVLLSLASEAGYQPAEFIDQYTTGEAYADFQQERMFCRRNGVTGFPTYIIRYDDKEVIVGGYQNLATFHSIISRLTADAVKPRRTGPSKANVVDFVRRFKTLYSVEIEVAFSLDRYQTDLLIDGLIEEGLLGFDKVGTTRRLYLPRPKTAPPTNSKHHAHRNAKK